MKIMYGYRCEYCEGTVKAHIVERDPSSTKTVHYLGRRNDRHLRPV